MYVSVRSPLACLALMSAACATSSPAPAPAPAPAGTFHTVQAGETVWDLARRSGLSVEEIVEVNGLPSANDLAAGQVLFLPAGSDRESASDEVVVNEDTEPEVEEPSAPAGPAPLVWPLEGVVLRDFVAAGAGKPASAPFDGLLIAAPAGTPVCAAADGEVLFVGDQGTDYGLLVVLAHAGGEDALVTVYGHLADPLVAAKDTVRAGQPLASVGTSGGVSTPRLHFQARRGRTPVDPLPLLPP